MQKKWHFSFSREEISFSKFVFFTLYFNSRKWKKSRKKVGEKWEKRKNFWFFYNFESTHIRAENEKKSWFSFSALICALEIVKKSKIFPFFPLFFIFFPFFFHFLELKYNVKNKNLENQISSRENENCNFLCIFFPYFLQKKILFSLSYG